MESSELKLPEEKMQWWRDAKFGIFLHWSLYSKIGRGEWVMFNEQYDIDEYAKVAEVFNPRKFDPGKWAAVAKAAGMKYMVLTARHHDGFSLFDSRCSIGDFTSINIPAKKDFVAGYVHACREAGLGVGIYYSPMDWRCPGYFFPKLYRKSAEEMRDQTYGQIRELMTNYGKIDVLWYDGGEDDWLGFGGIELDWNKGGWCTRPKDRKYDGKPLWEPLKMNAMVRELQPDIVINPRSGWEGDFDTPERKIGMYSPDRPWETCECLFEGWEWSWVPNQPVKSFRELVQLLVRVVTGGGNLLLNVGPDPDGEIPAEQVVRLKEIGAWLDKYGESIYGTRCGPFEPQPWGGFTQKGQYVYVHILEWKNASVVIPQLVSGIKTAHCLTGNQVEIRQTAKGLEICADPLQLQAVDTIIKVEVE